MMEEYKFEEYYSLAKKFLDTYRKEIGQSIREDKRVIIINFSDLLEFSPSLVVDLLNSPGEILSIFETALDDLGLIKGARILLKNVPEKYILPIENLSVNNLNKLVKIRGTISQIDKIKHRILDIKFECPSCGELLSVPQIESKIKKPSRCGCGRRDGFKIISKQMEDYRDITLLGKNDGEIVTQLDSFFLKLNSHEMLKIGSEIIITGILSEDQVPQSLDVEFKLIPLDLELLSSSENGDMDVEDFLKSMKSLSNKGPFMFEEFIAKLFDKKGYKTKVTRKTGDYGIDVTAEKGSERIAIQCKLNDPDTKIPNTLIQKALGALVSPYNSNKLIFITTAKEYTLNAREQIKESKVPIELWNRSRLIAEIKAHMLDLEEGWELLNEIKEGKVVNDVTNPTFDIDSIAIGVSSNQRGKVILVRETLGKLEERLGKFIPLEELEKEVEGKLTKQEVNESIQKLTASGDIFIPRKGFIQRI